MTKQKLPSDQEYFDFIFEQSDPELKCLDKDDVEAIKNRAAQVAKQRGYSSRKTSEFIDQHIENQEPRLSFQGYLINAEKKVALGFTGNDKEVLEKIPVGILPSLHLNAFAIKTPQSGAIIALNLALTHHLKILYYAVFSIISVSEKNAVKNQYSETEYVQSIVGLAELTVHSMKICKGKVPIIEYFDNLEPDEFVTHLSFFADIFILLHEYGHVISGHLSSNKTMKMTHENTDIEIYKKSHDEEYEADKYAFSKLCTRLEEEMALGIVGILFRFFDLCEKLSRHSISTHPAALDRWHHIKKLSKSNDKKIGLVIAIDNLFDKFVFSETALD